MGLYVAKIQCTEIITRFLFFVVPCASGWGWSELVVILPPPISPILPLET